MIQDRRGQEEAARRRRIQSLSNLVLEGGEPQYYGSDQALAQDGVSEHVVEDDVERRARLAAQSRQRTMLLQRAFIVGSFVFGVIVLALGLIWR